MKTSRVAMFGVALGAVLGTGISWGYFGNPPAFRPSMPTELEAAEGPLPKVLVNERFHDFGAVDRDATLRHSFRFTNIGEGILKLRAGTTSCTKCTVSELTKNELQPGESTDVIVEYITNMYRPTFQQTAPIFTNDPEQSRVELTITGLVTTKYRVVPDGIVLSSLSTNETRQAEIKVLAFLSDQTEVVTHEFSNPETADHYQVETFPLSAEQAAEAKAKSGCRVVVTVKPGLPLGPIRQTILLNVRMSGFDEITAVELPVSGTVDADISIAGGGGWNPEMARLTIGTVKSAQGAKRRLYILLKGDQRQGVKLTVGRLDPEWLKVTLGEATEMTSGTVTQIPLTIEIPPGSPAANYLGTEQAKLAHVVLDSTHPDVKEIHIDVKFLIE